MTLIVSSPSPPRLPHHPARRQMSLHEKMFWQPCVGLQISVVQMSSSAHSSLSGANTHESVASLHESSVQPISSPQTRGLPSQSPPPQTSPTVQNRPSSQL